MTTRLSPAAERLVAPLLAALGRGDLAAAEGLLAAARRGAPQDPRVRAIGLDLPLMRAARLAAEAGPMTDDEGEVLDRAYDAALEALTGSNVAAPTRRMAVPLLLRLGAWREVDRLTDFSATGREWAAAGRHGMLLQQLPRVRSHADKRELVEQHRIAAAALTAAAAQAPIAAPKPQPHARLRVGFLSADLRTHAVGAFALPLFEHGDPAEVELFAYSAHRGPIDPVERFFRTRCTFREIGALDDRSAAQLIAHDQLDVLVDLGGSTGANRLGVMAYRPAPLQVSWMGYPHSTGLDAIDHIVLDPRLQPASPDLLAETPLLTPGCWLSLARLRFSAPGSIEPEPPQTRSGRVTFGTMNQPYKYAPAVVAAWAQTLLATPGSRFLFVRPECASARFRANMIQAFGAHGVGPERLAFDAVRSGFIARYNEIDVALDTFPLTGGTTTCEALWMGVPTVTLVGEALYERLSYSILASAGLADLCARDVDAYVAAAADLAGDLPRLRALRASLRSDIAASPLGDGPGFAAAFFTLLKSAVRP